jgi:hypothetical protein
MAEYDALLSTREPRKWSIAQGTGPMKLLVEQKVFDRLDSNTRLCACATALGEKCGEAGVTQDKLKLCATTSIPGGGKTLFCHLVRGLVPGPGLDWRPDLLAAIQQGVPQGRRAPTHLVAMMITFNQCSSYDAVTEQPLSGSLSRAYADYQLAEWSPADSAKFPKISLGEFLKVIRELEAAKLGGGTDPSSIAVVLVVDEVMNVDNSTKLRSGLLNTYASTQQAELGAGRFFMPVVTSLRVSTFTGLTDTKRPVASIPLPLLTDGKRAVEDELCRKIEKADDIDFVQRANILSAVAATGGHPRLLESVMAHNSWVVPYNFKPVASAEVQAAVLECFLKTLADPQRQYKDGHEFSAGVPVNDLLRKTLVSLVNANNNKQEFSVKVLPWALSAIAPQFVTKAQSHSWSDDLWRPAQLLRALLNILVLTGNLEKIVERAIPMAVEMAARACFRHKAQIQQTSPVLLSNLLELGDGAIGLKFGDGVDSLQMRPDLVNFPVMAEPTEVKALKSASRNKPECHCVVSTNPNEPGLELVVHMCSVLRGGKQVNVPLCWQMKMEKEVGGEKMKQYIANGKVAMKKIGAEHGYLVMCMSSAMTAKTLAGATDGVIVLGPLGCQKLLEPYGMTPLRQLIELKAQKSPRKQPSK